MQTERRVAANPQSKPTDLGCESADQLLSSADTIAIYYYYSAHWGPQKLSAKGARIEAPKAPIGVGIGEGRPPPQLTRGSGGAS